MRCLHCGVEIEPFDGLLCDVCTGEPETASAEEDAFFRWLDEQEAREDMEH